MKEIEERVKKELRGSINMTSSLPSAQIYPTNSYTMIGTSKPSPLGGVDTPMSLVQQTERQIDNTSVKQLPGILGDELILQQRNSLAADNAARD